MSSIAQHLQHVQQQIAQVAGRAGRVPSSVQLLAVSKTFGPEAVAEAVAAGQRAFCSLLAAFGLFMPLFRAAPAP